MKILIKSLCTGFVIAVLMTLLPFEYECKAISKDVFRIHILANSDSDADQQLKLRVRDSVLRVADELFVNAKSKEEAEHIAASNLDVLLAAARQTVYESGSSDTVTGEIKNVYFNTRYYGDITMPSGFYDALQLKIGEAQGHNWWCVMYPSLCLYSAGSGNSLDDELTDEQYKILSSDGGYEVRFKVVEWFERICDFFSGE